MLRRQKEIRGRLHMLLDAVLFGCAWCLAYLVRSHWHVAILGGTPEIAPLSDYLWLLVAILPAGAIGLQSSGFYSRPLLHSRRITGWQLARGCLLAAGMLLFALWISRRWTLVARAMVPLFVLFSFILVYLKEEAVLRWRKSRFGQEMLQRRLILLGARDDLSRLVADLRLGAAGEAVVVAELDINDTPVDRLVEMMHEHSVNGVVICGQHAFFGQMERAIEVCEREGVEVWLMADFFKTRISQTRADELFGRPMLVFFSAPQRTWSALAKQVLDFVGASVLLLLAAVPMLVVAVLIRMTSPGPILFRQQRSGLNGRPFTMLKFRSMVSDAEQRKMELAALNEMSGPVFKLTNDPRVTAVGRFIRKYSIDELPQLINVWRGEMSLVGPRPLPVGEVERFDDHAHRRRLSVKPGLTCLWQVSGRNEVRDFAEWVRLDLQYIDNWSFWLDLKILVRTIPVVLTGAGAK